MNIVMPGKAAVFAANQREQAAKQREALGIEARSWYRITNAADPDEAEVMLYDEIGGWFGATADQFIEDLKGVTAPSLRVRVNSPGGSVFEGIAIANALRSHPANVTIQVDGIAASIASVIAMAGDRVVMAPQTMMMIHDASGLCLGNASDMEEMAELLDLISDNIADSYAARAGGTRDQWRARMRTETWYLPEDAVEAGLADEALPVPKRKEEEQEPAAEMRKSFDLTAYGYTGPKQPDPAPKQEPTLVISVGDILDAETVARLRAAVAPQASAEPVPEPVEEPAPAPELQGEHGPELVSFTPDPEPTAAVDEPPTEPVDEWTALVAHLTPPDPDPWAELVSHLTEPTASSSAATEAA